MQKEARSSNPKYSYKHFGLEIHMSLVSYSKIFKTNVFSFPESLRQEKILGSLYSDTSYPDHPLHIFQLKYC